MKKALILLFVAVALVSCSNYEKLYSLEQQANCVELPAIERNKARTKLNDELLNMKGKKFADYKLWRSKRIERQQDINKMMR